MLDQVRESNYFNIIADLTKKKFFFRWLLVVTYYNDFDEAVVVLSRMLCNIGLLESEGNQGDKESQSYLANAYLAVSEYYYEIMDYENVCIIFNTICTHVFKMIMVI